MKYIALLRGINVGGNSIIKMLDLKEAVEKCKFKNVRTYIQSGNVIFESDDNGIDQITARLENILRKTFQFNSSIIVRNYEQFRKVISEIPSDWEKRNDLRCYIAFIRGPTAAQDVMPEVELKDGVDSVKAGEGVLYMSTMLSGLTRSRFTKLISKKVYKDITIRNFNTVKKLLTLMEDDKQGRY
jgi:uncharacterized protein (DUF1697 family)